MNDGMYKETMEMYAMYQKRPSREQMQAKVKMMYEEYRQGATYEQIAEKYGYSTGRNVWRILFKVNDLPRLGRPERRKTIYAREHGSGNP